MFKVICIDASNTTPDSHLKEGLVDEVVGQNDNLFGCYSVYYLAGDPKEPYTKRRFIPLSSIDETTFEREQVKQVL